MRAGFLDGCGGGVASAADAPPLLSDLVCRCGYERAAEAHLRSVRAAQRRQVGASGGSQRHPGEVLRVAQRFLRCRHGSQFEVFEGADRSDGRQVRGGGVGDVEEPQRSESSGRAGPVCKNWWPVPVRPVAALEDAVVAAAVSLWLDACALQQPRNSAGHDHWLRQAATHPSKRWLGTCACQSRHYANTA